MEQQISLKLKLKLFDFNIFNGRISHDLGIRKTIYTSSFYLTAFSFSHGLIPRSIKTSTEVPWAIYLYGGCSVAKRFTDSEKWKKKWFRELPVDMKLFWIYLCDSCNHAGVWDVDMEAASFFIGKKIDKNKAILHIEKQLTILSETKWFIKDYVLFQQGVNSVVELNANNNSHKSIINLLSSNGVMSPCQGAGEPLPRAPSNIHGNGNSKKGGTGGKFVKPTENEVVAYCRSVGISINASKFIDFYESKGWVIGKTPMKDWKACLRRWQSEETHEQPRHYL